KYIENQQSRVRRTEKNLERFIDFQKYRKIDWWSVTAKIQGNTQKIEELRKTNDRVYTLKKQRDEILSQIRSKKEIVKELEKELHRIEAGLDLQQKNLNKAINVIEVYHFEDGDKKLEAFEKQFLDSLQLDIDSIERESNNIRGQVNKILD